jgi:glycine cleavage system H protein
MVTFEVAGYELCDDRLYDPETHMWVRLEDERRARLGLDPLGRETSGDVVALSLEPEGSEVARGGSFGDLEAAKFVGPLVSPVSGVVAARNENVLADPGVLNDDPATHWLVEIRLAADAAGELGEMLQGEAQVAPWFAAEVERFRTQGAIAE